MLEITINDNKISIKDPFTLIMGKFKINMLEELQNINIFQDIEDFETITLEKFLTFFKNRINFMNGLENAVKILDFLDEYRSITGYNTSLIDLHSNLVQNSTNLLKYEILLKKKEILNKELKIAKFKTHSSDIAAKKDLLNKLITSLTRSKKQVKYLEEDYLKIKNQKEAAYKEVESYKSEIEELNKQKKDFFNQINKITRGMDDNISNDDKNELKGLSKSEKIKSLQMNAKETQFEIKKIKAKLDNSIIKFDKINPEFEKIELDYQSIIEMINNDEEKIKNLKMELENGLNAKNDDKSLKLDFTELDIFKPVSQIENEIIEINNELNKLKKSIIYLNEDNSQDISKFEKEIEKIKKILSNEEDKLSIPNKREIIIEIMDSFKNIDILIRKIESMVNEFLSEINLKSIFNLIITNNDKNLSIYIQFIRSNKENINFKDLTTPEKVYFILSLYLVIQMQFDSNELIFSNLFINDKYNKRGSIFRTIKKMIPIFSSNSNLNKYRLIFILSNLELKDEIKNLVVINV